MSTAATERDYSQYDGKKVTVVRVLSEPNDEGESVVEVEGQVEVGNELGILLKPKGKVQFELIPADEIEEIYVTASSPKKFKASKLKIIELGQARRHLLDRHGVTVAWANEVTEEQAFEYHSSLDHEELDLGHVHVDKSADKSDDSNN